jgi:hypothetical protein
VGFGARYLLKSLKPEGGQQQQFVWPPSPLRNGFVPDTWTGVDVDANHDGDDDEAI